VATDFAGRDWKASVTGIGPTDRKEGVQVTTLDTEVEPSGRIIDNGQGQGWVGLLAFYQREMKSRLGK
jgi:hypothetical protein